MNPVFLLYRDLSVKVKLHIQGRAMAQEITSWTLTPSLGFGSISVYVDFVANKVRVEWFLPQVFWYYLIRIKSTMLRTHSFKCHRHTVFINLQPR